MTEAQQVYYMILGVIQELPPELRAKYEVARTELLEWKARHEDVGIIAIAAVTGKIAAESDNA